MRTEMPTPTGEEERLRIRPQRVGPSGRLEIAAVAAAAAAGASDWVSGSGTGANQRGQRTGGARHGVPTWQLPGICRVKLQDS